MATQKAIWLDGATAAPDYVRWPVVYLARMCLLGAIIGASAAFIVLLANPPAKRVPQVSASPVYVDGVPQ